MTTDDLIRDLCSWVQTLPQLKNEAELHAQILAKLKAMKLSCHDRCRLQNPEAGGVSKPDVRVTNVEPQLLIEIKANGGWKCVSHAAWQLFQASKLLQREGTTTRKLAVFGAKFDDPILRQMLATLDIESACVQV